MTRVIDRYFLKEFLPPCFFSIFALTFILLMDQLFRLIDLIVRKGLALAIVGQILVYTLPFIISFTAPMSILVAIVMSFGRFSQDNEILALKTSGISFFSILRTPLMVVGVIMIGLMMFNNFIVPEANHRASNLLTDVARKRPAVRLPEGVFTNEFPGYTIYIRKKDERTSKIHDIAIYDLKNNLIVTAPEGELQTIENEDLLRFILYNGELHQLVDNDKYQKTTFSTQIINMQMNTDLIRKERKLRNEDELDARGLYKRIDEIRKEMGDTRAFIQKTGEDAIARYLDGDIHSLDAGRFQIEQKLSVLNGKMRNRARYLLELNKKFSLAFACIVFLLIGAPLGYLYRKGGIAGILMGIMLFSMYYILVISGEELANRRNFSPFWAMWLPNVILLVPAILFFWIAEYERLPRIKNGKEASSKAGTGP
jgi:lipopolysaccharide export system permease protein